MSKYSWTDTPCQTVNYVEAHDNLTLWDKLFYSNPTDTEAVRIKMDKLAAAMVFLSQGIPFIQAGQDFLRSKPLPGGNSFDHNSYNSPDIINSIKWDRKNLYRDVFLYYKGLIEFRKAHPVLRMFTKDQVGENLRFFDNLPARVVGFGLYNEPGCPEILVFFNADDYPVKLFAFESYDVYIDGANAGIKPLYSISGDYEIAAISAMVMCKRPPDGEGG
jgi:pullulanase